MSGRWDGDGYCVACGHGRQAHFRAYRGLPIPCCGAAERHQFCGCRAAFTDAVIQEVAG